MMKLESAIDNLKKGRWPIILCKTKKIKNFEFKLQFEMQLFCCQINIIHAIDQLSELWLKTYK